MFLTQKVCFEGGPLDQFYRIRHRTYKSRLILLQSTDDSSGIPDNKESFKRIKNSKLEKTLIGVFVFGFLIIPITIAQAFFGSNKEEKNIKKEIVNSQNIDILTANGNFDSEKYTGGGNITVVDGTALLAESGVSGTVVDIESKKNNSGKINLYTVKPGDSLSQIAEMFQVSVNTIRWANDFEGAIQPGQELIILPVTGIRHVVENGGDIQDLADIYDADVQEIALFNGLSVDTQLKPGDEVIVPNVDHKSGESEIKEENTGKSSGTSTKLAVSPTPRVSFNGYYSHPVPGAIRTQGIHGYNAVDFGAAYGTPVRAAADGKVLTSKNSGWNGGYGNMIIITHSNGTQTLYSHMSSNVVYSGQNVSAGEVIGYVGSTGKSTGNHLHFEVRGATNPWGN